MKINWKLATTIIWILIPLALIGGVITKKYLQPSKDPQVYKVIYVYDGDSFSVKRDGVTQRARLMGTDAPELDQQFGPYSQKILSQLILNKDITFIYQTADHYNRLLGRISVVDPSGKTTEIEDVGYELIKRGATWPHRTHKSFRSKYLKAQEEAKLNKLGLWEKEHPTKPQEYRHSQDKKNPPSN